jgi:hypothetical protein
VTKKGPQMPVLAHSTKNTEIKTYKVRAYHEDCGGELVGTGHGVTAGSTAWEHRCKKCGAVGWVDSVNYPAIAYEE